MRTSEADAKKLTCHLSMARAQPSNCLGTLCTAWEWVYGQPEIGATQKFSLCTVDVHGNGQGVRDSQLKHHTTNGWKLDEPLDPACTTHRFKFVGPRKGFCQALHLDVEVTT